MSLAVLTDSTTAQASPTLTWRPTAGSSTNTMSVNSACAWSLMPIVAMSPLTRTHSCDLAYLRSEGTLLINLLLNLPADYADSSGPTNSKCRAKDAKMAKEGNFFFADFASFARPSFNQFFL